jgi:hypothetical protein
MRWGKVLGLNAFILACTASISSAKGTHIRCAIDGSLSELSATAKVHRHFNLDLAFYLDDTNEQLINETEFKAGEDPLGADLTVLKTTLYSDTEIHADAISNAAADIQREIAKRAGLVTYVIIDRIHGRISMAGGGKGRAWTGMGSCYAVTSPLTKF